MRSARRSRASLATFSSLNRSKQNTSDRPRLAKEAQADERPAECESNKESSNERQGHIKHHISALDRLHDISLGGRYRPRDVSGRRLRPRWSAHPDRLAVRNTGARGTAIGYVIMLLGSIGGLGVLVIHMRGAGLVGGRIANSSGVFFWVWTLIALGVTSTISIILSARGLWGLQRGQSR